MLHTEPSADRRRHPSAKFGEVPTAVPLHASLVTPFCTLRRKMYGGVGLPEKRMVFFLHTAVDRIRRPRFREL